jgi:hypothetical protein
VVYYVLMRMHLRFLRKTPEGAAPAQPMGK